MWLILVILEAMAAKRPWLWRFGNVRSSRNDSLSRTSGVGRRGQVRYIIRLLFRFTKGRHFVTAQTATFLEAAVKLIMATRVCLLFLSFLVVSRAQPSLIQQRAANLVTDGDFYDAPSSCFFEQNITCAGWTVTGDAEIVDGNSPGANYVAVWNYRPRDTGGTLSQDIEGFSTAETYTLSYDFRKYFNYKPTACTMTVTLGSQILDSVR